MHPVYWCNKFKKLSLENKLKEVKRLRLCESCLNSGHEKKNCRSTKTCTTCGKPHNSLLHDNRDVSDLKQKSSAKYSSEIAECNTTLSHIANSSLTPNFVLLSTALVDIEDCRGSKVRARALLDSGSQSNFISESLAQQLGLKRSNNVSNITGINSSGAKSTSALMAKISSHFNQFSDRLQFLVISKITQNYPPTKLCVSSFPIPCGIELADPSFHLPGCIDLLLGAEIFYDILCSDNIKLPNGLTSLQKTEFGWIVCGKVRDCKDKMNLSSNCHMAISNKPLSLERQMERFWEVEQCPKTSRVLTVEEKECIKHFDETVYRNKLGRFVITLPLKDDPKNIGYTRSIAEKSLIRLRKRLLNNNTLKDRYVSFMKEYEDLGHMKKAPRVHDGGITYYLPHHAVLKEDSLTTKLRVVFNASAKGSNGVSLNDVLMVGPVIQDDLFSLVIRFRQHQFAICGDITKMYRMILLNSKQHDLHRILWWDDGWEKIEEYSLVTLTYGTAPASYLATQCLHKLADDVAPTLKIASLILKRDFLMDDLISGSDTIENCKRIQDEVSEALRQAGMQMCKWCSNHPTVLEHLPAEHCVTSGNKKFEEEGFVKTLGIAWNPQQDEFQYSVTNKAFNSKITKRNVLSDIASLFDPLGLVAPVVVKSKILMQNLWKIKLDWDEELPPEILKEWKLIHTQLSELSDLRIPRKIIPNCNPKCIEIHGFSDASESAYGACLYLRCLYADGSISSRLIASKSRVAPLKLVTIPRLELCGALLLCELYSKVVKSLDLPISSCMMWTDSTVVLGWINTSKRLHTFVANRISKILDHTKPNNWCHVRSECNPADYLSRGATPSQMLSLDLWWYGPEWLSMPHHQWPSCQIDIPSENLPESKDQLCISLIGLTDGSSILSKFSKLNDLLRITCWCKRFAINCKNPGSKLLGPIQPVEIHNALLCWVKFIQNTCFSDEIKNISGNLRLPKKSKLAQLNPFLDDNGLLRVGGRLSKSKIDYDRKYPFLLPSSHPFVLMLAEAEHIRLLHAGPQALLSSLRRRFWPLRGKDLVKKVFRQCVQCFRANPQDVAQLMGELPLHRVEPARPFLHSGIDFCGPMYIKTGSRRNSKIVKCYVSVFVCFCTKAVHLELVSDLTTDAFMGALHRFVGRRGKPTHLYSDNATNFVGAKNQLNELNTLFNSEAHKFKLNNFLTNEHSIKWATIPPRSPHHGGLWESAVKSFKYHLRRIVGNALLNFEEFNTILVQIEACLNSRPLTSLSNEPSDLLPITPSHFLVGDVLTSIPEPDLQPLKIGLLSRWQLVQRLLQNFWSRWSKEYLSELQSRTRWRKLEPNINVGALVLIKEDNLPPLKWHLGRVIQVHPGDDGLVRVVTLRTSTGVLQRSIRKICPLPIKASENDVPAEIV